MFPTFKILGKCVSIFTKHKVQMEPMGVSLADFYFFFFFFNQMKF